MVENTYGCLKARWQRLMKRNDMHINHIPNVVAASCILHNLCEIHGEHFNDTWLQDFRDSDYSPPPTVAIKDGSSNQPKCVRDALVQYFRSN